MDQDTKKPDPDAWVSELKVSYETMGALVRSITRELHDLAALGYISRHAIEGELVIVLDELCRELPNLIRVTPVVTSDATDLLSVRTSICPVAYRRAAEAAKDRMRSAV